MRNQKSRGVSRDLYIFWIFFRKSISLPSFIIKRYVWHILGRGAFLPHHYPWAAPKRPILNWVNNNFVTTLKRSDLDKTQKLLICHRTTLSKTVGLCGQEKKFLSYPMLLSLFLTVLKTYLPKNSIIIFLYRQRWKKIRIF